MSFAPLKQLTNPQRCTVGEGFAYFRWTCLMKDHYMVRECRAVANEQRWPIPSEWRALQHTADSA